MLIRTKTLLSLAIAGPAALLAAGLGLAGDPGPGIATPGDLPKGWIRKEIEIRFPVIVPEDICLPSPQQFLQGMLPSVTGSLASLPQMGVTPWPQVFPNPWTLGIPGGPMTVFEGVRGPVDEGSLQTKEQQLTDLQGRQWLVIERAWTSGGVPCRSLEMTQPAPAAAGQAETKPPAEPPSQPIPAPAPNVNPAPETSPNTPWGSAQASVKAASPALGSGVGVGVTVDPQHGTRVYEYRWGK